MREGMNRNQRARLSVRGALLHSMAITLRINSKHFHSSRTIPFALLLGV